MQRMRQLGMVIVAVASTLTLAVVPVAAESGSTSGGTSGSISGSTSGSGDSHTTTTNTTTTTVNQEPSRSTLTENHTSTGTTNPSVELERSKAKETLAKQREGRKQKSQVERSEACEAHKESINDRISVFSTAAQNHLDAFTGVLTKTQDFYADKKLTVANYSTLLATALADKAAAQTAVNVLKMLNVKIDCTQPDPAQSIATVKVAVTDARTALQTYRAAIKALVAAVKSAAEAAEPHPTTDTSNTAAGGNQ